MEDLTGNAWRDAGEKSRREHSWTQDAVRWGLVGNLLARGDTAGKPVKARFSAQIRSAGYTDDGPYDRHVTLSLDRVEWNPKWSDGSDEDILLNPVVKWETIHSGDLLVLVNPGDGLHQVPIETLPALIRDAKRAANQARVEYWATPFTVYFIGDEPVALVEWYVP